MPSPFQDKLDLINEKTEAINALKEKSETALANGNTNEYRDLQKIISSYEDEIKRLYKFFD